MAKPRPAASSDTSSTAQTDDSVQALIGSADKLMRFAGDLPYQQCELVDWYKVRKRLNPEVEVLRSTLYKNVSSAMRALHQTGADYSESELRCMHVVGICNDFLKWGRRNLGQGPPMPDGSKEPNEQDDPVWTDRQLALVKDRAAFFENHRDACADLLRWWQTVKDSAPPAYTGSPANEPAATVPPVEATEPGTGANKNAERRLKERLALAELLLHGPNATRIARTIGVPRPTLLGWTTFREQYDKLKMKQQEEKEQRRQRLQDGDHDEDEDK